MKKHCTTCFVIALALSSCTRAVTPDMLTRVGGIKTSAKLGEESDEMLTTEKAPEVEASTQGSGNSEQSNVTEVITPHRITIDFQNGEAPMTIYVKPGHKAFENIAPPDPVKEGYALKGWDFSPNGKIPLVPHFFEKCNYEPRKNETFYAIWAPGVVVTFDLDNGTPIQTVDVVKGDVIRESKIPKPESNREGYFFSAWRRFDEEANKWVTIDDISTYVFDAPTQVKAHYGRPVKLTMNLGILGLTFHKQLEASREEKKGNHIAIEHDDHFIYMDVLEGESLLPRIKNDTSLQYGKMMGKKWPCGLPHVLITKGLPMPVDYTKLEKVHAVELGHVINGPYGTSNGPFGLDMVVPDNCDREMTIWMKWCDADGHEITEGVTKKPD